MKFSNSKRFVSRLWKPPTLKNFRLLITVKATTWDGSKLKFFTRRRTLVAHMLKSVSFKWPCLFISYIGNIDNDFRLPDYEHCFAKDNLSWAWNALGAFHVSKLLRAFFSSFFCLFICFVIPFPFKVEIITLQTRRTLSMLEYTRRKHGWLKLGMFDSDFFRRHSRSLATLVKV